MFTSARGPIEHFSWSMYIIQGKEHAKTNRGKIGVGKDIRLIGHDVSAWRERKGHRLTPAMITGPRKRLVTILSILSEVYNRSVSNLWEKTPWRRIDLMYPYL